MATNGFIHCNLDGKGAKVTVREVPGRAAPAPCFISAWALFLPLSVRNAHFGLGSNGVNHVRGCLVSLQSLVFWTWVLAFA